MKKLRICLIGAGNIANVHLTSYKKLPDVEIAAICDINETRLNKTADLFNIKNRYTDVNKMLESETLDAADVCVWNCNHAKCAKAAMEAGLNVIVEKPMAYNAKEAKELVELSKKTGKLLMVGFVSRFSKYTKVVKDFSDKGFFGDIYYSKATYIRRHGNPGGWFSNKELSGGGPIIDLGVHVIDIIRYLAGSPNPVSVYAVTSEKLGNRQRLKTNVGWTPKDAKPTDICNVEDFGSAIIRYDNGLSMLLETSYDLNGESKGKKELFGTKAGALINDNALKFYTEINDYMVDVTPVELDKLIDGGDSFDNEMNHFVDCCLNNTKCISTAEDGYILMQILDAIYESAKTGHEVIIEGK